MVNMVLYTLRFKLRWDQVILKHILGREMIFINTDSLYQHVFLLIYRL